MNEGVEKDGVIEGEQCGGATFCSGANILTKPVLLLIRLWADTTALTCLSCGIQMPAGATGFAT